MDTPSNCKAKLPPCTSADVRTAARMVIVKGLSVRQVTSDLEIRRSTLTHMFMKHKLRVWKVFQIFRGLKHISKSFYQYKKAFWNST